ncbi:GNAT family N-acetyltransferase [Jannaschia seohaensis]|uniref:Carbonic anhydrase n=1 Tax=Jannaschia seohaensis TaxID=475081 RepID=A0A2Y9AHI1_9RHOB|nr:GNAT family N-acetyltransferase [Jannaschia seohaensis]PWJ21383.1 carbonic anhydrase [Jannaschia seohaensis]SSA41989.1 carbonic anhydrase [Jannaschia seohaensis]
MIPTVARATTREDLDAVRDLIRAFAAWGTEQEKQMGGSGTPKVFADLDVELAGLPCPFGPPGGCLVLARLDGAPAGCVGFRDLGRGTMEVKRMFVLPEMWGRGVGGAMLDVLLIEARAAGHARAVLSTHHALLAAQTLYARKGFRPMPPTGELPGIEPDIEIFMAMLLHTPDRI